MSDPNAGESTATRNGTSNRAPLADDAPHLLIVDDDKRIRDLLSRFLSENGFRVTQAGNAAMAHAAMRGLEFDLIVLDVMMPGQNGVEFAAALRSRGAAIPILMLTANSAPEQRIEGLEAGVDDYLPKPFEPRELLLRLRNILKRRELPSEPAHDEIRMGPFTFHVERGELKKGQETIRLTERERVLLRQFSQRPGNPIARHELAPDDTTGSDRAIDVQINRLRRKIETDPSNPVYLQTVRGKGYILYTD